VNVEAIGATVRRYSIDTDDLGIAHAPFPVEPGDLVALSSGRPFRVIRIVSFRPGDVIDAVAEGRGGMTRRRERSVLCSMPGCGAVLDAPGRCARHQVDGWSRFRASPQGQARARGYDARWRRVRDRRLAAFPICEDCQHAPSTQGHHIGHERPGEHGFYDYDRIRALCDRCHRRRSQRSRKV
jgi:5-methylcytosine-specific restriction protein A